MSSLFAKTAVTYDFSGGRFGDNVLAYLHAKWLAFEYDLPLLYRPFLYSSELAMHDQEQLTYACRKEYKKQAELSCKLPKPVPSPSTLFICPYFPEMEWELKREGFFSFKPDWKNREFRQIVTQMVSPKSRLNLIYPPRGHVSVAVHLRDGREYDGYQLHFADPLKVPPLSFYIESLSRVVEMVQGRSIYCHVFTDSSNPAELVGEIQQGLPPDAQIIFQYRKNNNRHDANVLEDFFSLLNFDILIRAESNYSIVPALIHDYAAVFYPRSPSIKRKVVKINEIKCDFDDALFRNCLDSCN
jgi:hypothetical protein